MTLKYFSATIFVLIAISSQPLVSQNSKPPIIDNKVAFFKPKNNNLQSLARHITSHLQTDEAKARAIYNWIVKNISYDHELRFSQKLQKQIYVSEDRVISHVLSRKKALCGGYAFLYKALCSEIAIKVEVIHGFSKKPGKELSDRIDHTWNAVYYNGKWQLLDITYARGNRKNMHHWFNCDPKFFIKTHYPEHTKWSLLAQTPSKDQAFL